MILEKTSILIVHYRSKRPFMPRKMEGTNLTQRRKGAKKGL
jgi:hypothetical protein